MKQRTLYQVRVTQEIPFCDYDEDGAFSSNKGEDFRRVLEEITQSNISMPKSGKWATAGMVGNEGPGGGRSVYRMAIA